MNSLDNITENREKLWCLVIKQVDFCIITRSSITFKLNKIKWNHWDFVAFWLSNNFKLKNYSTAHGFQFSNYFYRENFQDEVLHRKILICIKESPFISHHSALRKKTKIHIHYCWINKSSIAFSRISYK